MWWATYGASLVFIAAILLYGFVLARCIRDRFHIVANAIMSVAAIAYGLWQGIDFAAMGLSIQFIIPGLVIAILASLAVVAGTAIATLIPPLHKLITIPRLARPGSIAYQTAVRIPLSTALSEEVLFRGVLLGLLVVHSPTIVALITCSLVFGVWHALPSMRDHHKLAVLPIIFATAVAGSLFCWLRLLAGSILAPWLLHWTINASGLLAVHIIHKQKNDN